MFIQFLYLSLNIILVLNLFSYYNNFFLNVEVLLFLLFIFIVFNIFRISYKLLGIYLLQQKNLIVEEYYNKFFDFFHFLNFYKSNLKIYVKNLIYNIILLKFVLQFFRNFYFKKLIFLKNIITYLVNNFLYVYYLQDILLKKLKTKNFFILKIKNFLFLKFYFNILKPSLNTWISNI